MSSILFLLRVLDGDGDMVLVLDVGAVVVSGRMRNIRATSMLVASLVLFYTRAYRMRITEAMGWVCMAV